MASRAQKEEELRAAREKVAQLEKELGVTPDPPPQRRSSGTGAGGSRAPVAAAPATE